MTGAPTAPSGTSSATPATAPAVDPAGAPLLSRSTAPGPPAAPVRILHVGVGNFFRAHQAWYTDQAADAAHWGIAAFTGRSPGAAQTLRRQDGLYTLITRTADGDRFHVVRSLSAVHPVDEHDAWLDYWCRREVVLVTLTVTEAGYLNRPDGGLDTSRADVRADTAALRADRRSPVRTTPGRLVAGLLARRDAGAGGIALVPCDNLPDNGTVLSALVTEFAAAVDPSLVGWLEQNVTVATTMVDRITPATSGEHRALVLAGTGHLDAAPVATEAFSEWVVQGDFPHGRPSWETAGARFVQDVAPFEQRKLRLLNGAHSLLAYAGSAIGHETVADAIADPRCRAWVEQWWQEASADLPLPVEELVAYRRALLDRFGNPSIRHSLAQIAVNGSQKIPARVLPTLRAARAAGSVPAGAARILAAWVGHLRGNGAPIDDVRAAELRSLTSGSVADSVERVVAFVAPDLAGDEQLIAAVLERVQDLSR
ncbi:mannitol dehydrogenase family protein [Kineococcus arenarius]|uniref:mannitol dehydrogenase family protein n=1 Tax=unclassified Kineococcus TaxID=2621656 RepID=UPI003D7EA5C1